jgi:hypothetical protein
LAKNTNFGLVLPDTVTGAVVSGAFGLDQKLAAGTEGSTATQYYAVNFDASRVARTSTETRGANTAYYPRIHV